MCSRAKEFACCAPGLGYFLLATLIGMLPMVLLGAAGMALQWGWLMGFLQHLGDPSWPLTHRQPTSATLVQLLSYPVMFAGSATIACLVTRGGLDELAGSRDSLFGTFRRSLVPIAWLAVCDTFLGVLVYVGCVCCCVPGFVGAIFVAAWLGLQTSALCSERLDWFAAARRSHEMSRGREGTLLALAFTCFGAMIALSLVAAALAFGMFFAVNGGIDLQGPRVSAALALAYTTYFLFYLVPGMLLWVWWILARTSLYHRLTRTVAPQELASVFA